MGAHQVSSAINAAHAWDAGPQSWQGAVGALAPVELVVKSTPELLHTMDSKTADTRTDGGYPDGVRRIRTAARGRVAERLDEIDRLALKTGPSGRAIADELGLGRTSVCARVSAVRARRTHTQTPDTDAALLAV